MGEIIFYPKTYYSSILESAYFQSFIILYLEKKSLTSLLFIIPKTTHKTKRKFDSHLNFVLMFLNRELHFLIFREVFTSSHFNIIFPSKISMENTKYLSQEQMKFIFSTDMANIFPPKICKLENFITVLFIQRTPALAN